MLNTSTAPRKYLTRIQQRAPLRNKNICEYIERYNVIYEIIYFDIWDTYKIYI